jgi:opine dehydrogenase
VRPANALGGRDDVSEPAVGKIAVLGGGPGSQAMAGDLALRGFEVHFWGRDPWKLATLFRFKQIRMIGYPEGIGQLADAGDDLGRTLQGARLIIVSLPGSAHAEVAERCAPFLEDGQTIFVCSNSGMGSLRFATVLRARCPEKDVLCAEYSGGAVGGRLLEPGLINRAANFRFGIEHHGLRVGVFPARRTAEAMELISQVYPGAPAAENCMAAALSNRAIQHQAVAMLMGASAIEHLSYWDITAEGHTPSVMKVSRAVDEERKAIQRAWGFTATELFGAAHRSGDKTDWDEFTSGPSGRPTRDFRIKSAWKDRLDMKHRFVVEAVSYGHVFRSSLAARRGVSVPITDSLIRLFSAINDEDYFRTGMTLDGLGFAGRDPEEILGFLRDGPSGGATGSATAGGS